jgi:hypothetical protein
MGYAEIAEKLGCSEVWCKKNLRGVVKNSSEKESIARCITMSLSKQGITYGEIAREINASLGLYNTTNKEAFDRAMARYKFSINKVEGSIIRPYWMSPDAAKPILQAVLREINDLDSRMYEGILNIRREFGLNESYDSSLYRVISGLMYFKHKGHEGEIGAKLENLNQVALALAALNPVESLSEPYVEDYDVPASDEFIF